MVQRNVDLVDLEKMLKHEPTLAIVAVHTADNEPLKVLGGDSIQYSMSSIDLNETLRGSFSAVWTATIATK